MQERKKSNNDYYNAHKEEIKKRSKEYYRTHREQKKEYQRKWYNDNKEARKEYKKRYDADNKERGKLRFRKFDLKRKFGISEEDYTLMFNKQEGNCAICGKNQSEFKRALAVDHCHNSGKIRGLLCYKCNQGLGQFNDNPILLLNAIKYLKRIL